MTHFGDRFDRTGGIPSEQVMQLDQCTDEVREVGANAFCSAVVNMNPTANSTTSFDPENKKELWVHARGQEWFQGELENGEKLRLRVESENPMPKRNTSGIRTEQELLDARKSMCLKRQKILTTHFVAHKHEAVERLVLLVLAGDRRGARPNWP